MRVGWRGTRGRKRQREGGRMEGGGREGGMEEREREAGRKKEKSFLYVTSESSPYCSDPVGSIHSYPYNPADSLLCY